MIYDAAAELAKLKRTQRTLERKAKRAKCVTAYSLTTAGNPRKILGRGNKTDLGLLGKVDTLILYASPADESGYNLCPWSTPGCVDSCLGHSSGRMVFNSSEVARIAKARWLVEFPAHFKAQLNKEVAAHARRCAKSGYRAAVRLNGSTDQCWEKLIDMELHPTVTFYDYTKAPLEKRGNNGVLPANYSLTFSYSEAPGSHAMALQYLAAGHNVAIVTRNKAQSAQLVADGFCGFPAIDGDVSDIRFDDPPGHWVALYAKGSARKDTSGFVQDIAA